jgi:hypothetical protein
MARDRDQRYSDVNLLAMALEDELTPSTPAPRLLTPQAGVPSFAAHDSLSGPHAPVVEAVLNKEPSGQHQGTRILFTFPLEAESKESATPWEANGGNGGNGGLNGGSEEAAASLPTGHDTAPVDLRAWLGKMRSPGIGTRSALRGWGGLAGAGVAVVFGFVVVSAAMRGVHRLQTGAPTPIADGTPRAREAVVQPAVPAAVSTATVDPVAAPAPLTISSSPPAPSALATREDSHPARHVRAMPVVSRSRMVERETSNDLPPRQQARRRPSGRDESAQAASSARRAGTSVSPAPRAGGLSKDDF